MSLLQRDELPYPTYDLMLEHLLEQIQDGLSTPLDELIMGEVSPNLLKRINSLAHRAFEDLKITYFTFDEMVEILQSDEQIREYRGKPGILFTFLKPEVNLEEDEDQVRFSIQMALDYQIVN